MTQSQAVFRYMKDNGTITPMEAFEDLGVTKLATVVSVMIRHEGIAIDKTKVKTVNRYGRPVTYMQYSLRS